MKKLKDMDLYVIAVFALLIVFTITMVITFNKCYAIPDTLCTCVYGCLGAEYGALAWIKTTKERKQERKWQKEDYKQYREEQREQMNSPVPPVEEIKMEESHDGTDNQTGIDLQSDSECVGSDCSPVETSS